MKGIAEILDVQISQADFAATVGLSEARVSQLMKKGVLTRGDSGSQWIAAYCEHLRDMAAGRGAEAGELDLAQERAKLANEQRVAQRIKNLVALEEFAPVSALTDTLAAASRSLVAKLDLLPGQLHKAVPDLPEEALDIITSTVARARNDWVGDTEALSMPGQVDLDDDDYEDTDR